MKTRGLAVMASIWLVACGDSPTSGTAPVSDAVLTQGAALYAAQCANCHGAKLEGQPDWRERKADGRLPAPPHDATGHTWHHPMEMLVQMTRDGMVPPLAPEGYQSDMPAFGHILSDDEIRAVLAYIESQWPDEVKQMRAERFKPQTSGR